MNYVKSEISIIHDVQFLNNVYYKGGLAVLAFFTSRKFTVAVVFILIRLPF